MPNNDPSFYTVRFDAISQTLQYAVGQNWVDVPNSGGGTPGGPTNSIQYNGSGIFAGSADLSFIPSNDNIILTGNSSVGMAFTFRKTLDINGPQSSIQFESLDGIITYGTMLMQVGENADADLAITNDTATGSILLETDGGTWTLDASGNLTGSGGAFNAGSAIVSAGTVITTIVEAPSGQDLQLLSQSVGGPIVSHTDGSVLFQGGMTLTSSGNIDNGNSSIQFTYNGLVTSFNNDSSITFPNTVSIDTVGTINAPAITLSQFLNLPAIDTAPSTPQIGTVYFDTTSGSTGAILFWGVDNAWHTVTAI